MKIGRLNSTRLYSKSAAPYIAGAMGNLKNTTTVISILSSVITESLSHFQLDIKSTKLILCRIYSTATRQNILINVPY